MTLEEAILTLENMVDSDEGDFGKENREAMQLGIEALKRIQHHRETGTLSTAIQLPGETKE